MNVIKRTVYNEFKQTLVEMIQQAKLQTIMNVNSGLLTLYWNLGTLILQKQKEQGWGSQVVEQVSKDLSKTFPDDKGYSVRNLKYMRAFAEAYPDFPIVQVPLAQITWYNTAQYETEKLFADVKSALPTIEEIEKGLSNI